MLQVEQLHKAFGDRIAVEELSLQIENELFVFLGPNGAGKTTTIKMMTGLLHPDRGRVLIDGIDLATDPIGAKRLFGLVQESPVLYEKLSAREFVHFMARLYQVPDEDAARRAGQLFDIFEISDRADELIEEFSHGMKQKVALAGALVHEPRVLFLDEPTVGLDPKAARNLKDLLRGMVERGTTVFMSTHILEVAERMCDRAGIIHQGRLIALGTMDELRKNSATEKASLEEIFLQLTASEVGADVNRFLEEQ
ncbi:MAG: ABC-type transporter ATP-binding protein EcsA [bacterium ADurb.Bin431]|nr:MAG: ABC-type transporter ATP-binding protein EcsA [bacterium ADurb.Bin431]HNY91550.1 ABC transporter ATP-binding protein [bacterium]HOH06823.1 ABC transporter ATP-binding protein [bacterium]